MKTVILSTTAATALAADSARAADSQSITVDAKGDFGTFDMELTGIAEQVRVAANEMKANLAHSADVAHVAELSRDWGEQVSMAETGAGEQIEEKKPDATHAALAELNMENIMTHKSGIAMAERAVETAEAYINALEGKDNPNTRHPHVNKMYHKAMTHIDPHLYLGYSLGHPSTNWIVHWGDWLFGTKHPTDHLTNPNSPAALISRKAALEKIINHAREVRDFAKGAVKRGVSMMEMHSALADSMKNPMSGMLSGLGSMGCAMTAASDPALLAACQGAAGMAGSALGNALMTTGCMVWEDLSGVGSQDFEYCCKCSPENADPGVCDSIPSVAGERNSAKVGPTDSSFIAINGTSREAASQRSLLQAREGFMGLDNLFSKDFGKKCSCTKNEGNGMFR